MFSDDDLKRMGIGKGYTFLSYVIIFLVGALILVFIVAFIHDLFTGQLPTGGGGGYEDGGDGGYDGFGRR
jgi:hypothetical protein